MTEKYKGKTICVIRGFSKKKGESLDIRLPPPTIAKGDL